MLFRLVKTEDIWVRPYTLATTTTGKTFHQSTKGEGNHYSKKDKITIQNVRPEKTKRIGMEEIATYAKETILRREVSSRFAETSAAGIFRGVLPFGRLRLKFLLFE